MTFDTARAKARSMATLALVALGGLTACGQGTEAVDDWVVVMPDAASEDVRRVEGTVTHVELEGGFFVIRTADGTSYNPQNLPSAFEVDGTGVEADVIVRDDMASITMVGPIVDVVRLRRTAGE